jgi:signal transduction histidine kinase
MLNLISNAIKFSHKDSKVYIDIYYSTEPFGPNHMLSVVVSDSGIGIPANELKLIHQPFFKSARDVIQNTNNQGAGLGLHITKRICAQIDAHLDIVSQEDKGTSAMLIHRCKPIKEAPTRKKSSNDQYLRDLLF